MLKVKVTRLLNTYVLKIMQCLKVECTVGSCDF